MDKKEEFVRDLVWFAENSPYEMNNDLGATLNELDEIQQGLELLKTEYQLGGLDEIIDALIQRTDDAMNWLHKYVGGELIDF